MTDAINVRGATRDRKQGLQADRGPLANLYAPTGKNVLTFPKSLNDSDHWVVFRVGKERKLRRKAVPTKESLCSIFLPVPQNLKTGYKAGYNNESIGALGETVRAAVLEGEQVDKGDLAKRVAADIANSAEASGLAGAAVGNFIGGQVGSIVGAATGVGIAQGVKAAFGAKGIARNPHQAILFQGTDFRSHSFSYKFTPRNELESEELKAIIYAFKFFMAPRLKASNHFYDYPEQFDIDFKDEDNLFDIGASVLTDFNVDYHAEGLSAYYVNNQPVSISLEMNFQEISITTKDEIEKFNR